MQIMRELAAAGTSIIFITHKLREVKEVADKITVIRQGKVVGDASPSAAAEELASMMVGREVDLEVDKSPAKLGEVVVEFKDISVLDDRSQLAVDGIDLEVRGGEILAIAGVQGNGQTELAEALLGLRQIVKGQGSIKLNGQPIHNLSVRQRLEAGISFVPEDRKKDGLVGEFTIAENMMLNGSRSHPFANGIWIDFANRDRITNERIREFDIRTQSSETLAENLSGGNQQKVVVARELSRSGNLLLAAQPTRGVDVGSIEFIHERIVAERNEGRAVILISTELDEVIALADRIAVMYRGKIVGIVDANTPRAQLGKMMAGIAA
jgi:simple sugar transport system ATP-binding protein